MCYFHDNNGKQWSYTDVRAAMQGEAYPMSLVGDAASIVQRVVNLGIDAHLECCFAPARGDSYTWAPRRTVSGIVHTVALDCVVSPESMPVLLRRLFSADEDEAATLAQDILDSLVASEED